MGFKVHIANQAMNICAVKEKSQFADRTTVRYRRIGLRVLLAIRVSYIQAIQIKSERKGSQKGK